MPVVHAPKEMNLWIEGRIKCCEYLCVVWRQIQQRAETRERSLDFLWP